MSSFFWDHNKYGEAEATNITRLYHTAIRKLVREKLIAAGKVAAFVVAVQPSSPASPAGQAAPGHRTEAMTVPVRAEPRR